MRPNILFEKQYFASTIIPSLFRVATVREKYLENEIFSWSGKSEGIWWMAREIEKGLGKSGNLKINGYGRQSSEFLAPLSL